MIEPILITYFITLAFAAILNKYNATEKLASYFARNKFGLLLDAVECDLCLSHHLAIIPTTIVYSFVGFDWFVFFVPLTVTGINIAVKRWK